MAVENSLPITIVSNRLPVKPEKENQFKWKLTPSSGGLVNVLDTVLRQNGGRWVGWSGTEGDIDDSLTAEFSAYSRQRGYELQPVALTGDEIEGYYNGFSNRAIWPLFHNLLGQCVFDPEEWACYQQVNRKFARTLTEMLEGSDVVWVHDYHFMLIAEELKAVLPQVRALFFLHIPFPPPETFVLLPWRDTVLRALLQYDLLGFQTVRDRDNFLECAALYTALGQVQIGDRLVCLKESPEERGDHPGNGGAPTCYPAVGAFPISIDFDEFECISNSDKVQRYARELAGKLPGNILIFGADRLDYTKGLLQRMRAYQRFLRNYPEMHGEVTFVQYVVPGRETIPEYGTLQKDLERLVGEIIGEFTQPGWIPVHYVYDKLALDELVAYYRIADVAVVTPVKDGMNLVAKEYCAARTNNDGVLLLSEFAGAAEELNEGAILVNPYNEVELADALRTACTMAPSEQERRMRLLRERVRNWSIDHWAQAFLACIPETDYKPVENAEHISWNRAVSQTREREAPQLQSKNQQPHQTWR